ncbi:DUF1559 family PulG-like putative transporter [Stieleria varia]|nr:DUF1559 domain-containing protein [Stieleria varia]
MTKSPRTQQSQITKKCTRVAGRAFHEVRVTWRQPGDFDRSSLEERTLTRNTKIALAIACSLLAISFIGYVVPYASQRRAEQTCAANLRYVGHAVQSYHSSFGRFPSPDCDGHSWRIRCVPFMFASPMYGEYRFDEPWDSEANISIDTRPLPTKDFPPDGGPPPEEPHGMPYAYQCIDESNAHHTAFLMLVGVHAFGKPGGWRRSDEIVDGLETTLAIVETIRSDVHWLDPTDLNIDKMSFSLNDGLNSISSPHASGPAVLFCDGAVYRLHSSVTPDLLRAMVTIDGGEPISRDEMIAKGYLVPH